MFDLRKKTVLVAGGSGLIGSEMVAALRKRGAYTFSIDLKDELNNITFDISRSDLWDVFFENMESCDAFVNLAYPAGLVDHMQAFFVSALKVADYMKDAGGGAIVSCSSIYGVVGSDPSLYRDTAHRVPAGYAYNKSGIVGLTRWIASNYGKYGVRANAICPGGVFDNQDSAFVERYIKKVPLGCMVDFDSICQTIIYLICCKAITGQAVVVDGGYTIQ